MIVRGHVPVNKLYRFNWIDRTGLVMSVAVMAMFLGLWALLVLAAGSAPTGRLSALCLQWAMKALAEGIVPVWLIARALRAIASRSVGVFSSTKYLFPRAREVQLPNVVPSVDAIR